MHTESALDQFANRVSRTEALRKGDIVFRLSGTDGGEFCLKCSSGGAQVMKKLPSHAPLIEVIGDAQQILAILKGNNDSRARFFAGGFRPRGDLRYESNLANHEFIDHCEADEGPESVFLVLDGTLVDNGH